MSTFIEKLYTAVQAYLVQKVRVNLQKSGKYLDDLLRNQDKDRDSCLNYKEI